jgi:hypothetical protein
MCVFGLEILCASLGFSDRHQQDALTFHELEKARQIPVASLDRVPRNLYVKQIVIWHRNCC